MVIPPFLPPSLQEAAWTISNITAGQPAQIQAVIDMGLIPPLVQIMVKVWPTPCTHTAAVQHMYTQHLASMCRYFSESMSLPLSVCVWCVCVCGVCVCVCVYVCAHVCTCVHVLVCGFSCLNVHTCKMHACMCLCVCVCVCGVCVCVCVCTCVHMCACACVWIFMSERAYM